MVKSYITILLLWYFSQTIESVNVGEAYGFINSIQTECEFQSLTLGSRLSDAFNSYDEFVPFYQRFYHEYQEKSSSFHRMIMLEMERRHLPNFQKANNLKKEDKIHKYHHHHHTVHSNDTAHPFHSLVNKAIAFVGDFTLFPVFTSLLVPLHGHSPSNELDRTLIDLCPSASVSVQSSSLSDLSELDNAIFTCTGYGHDGALSFHQSNYLLERNSINVIKDLYSQSRPPEVLVMEVGYLACLLPFNATSGIDQSFTSKAEGNIKQFFNSVQEIIQKSLVNTTVVVSLPSRALVDRSDADYCTWRLNRIIAFEAHVKGYIVLEKEEIEMRLLFRTERALDPMKPAKSLLSFPGSQIVAASLVSLLNCLQQGLVFSL